MFKDSRCMYIIAISLLIIWNNAHVLNFVSKSVKMLLLEILNTKIIKSIIIGDET